LRAFFTSALNGQIYLVRTKVIDMVYFRHYYNTSNEEPSEDTKR